MRTTRPLFDIQIGNTRLSEAGLLDYVISVRRNRNNDRQGGHAHKRKTPSSAGTGAPVLGKGRRVDKINSCVVTLDNKDGELTDIMRLGTKLKLWLGYADYPLVAAGTYSIDKPQLRAAANGGSTLILNASGRAFAMGKDFTERRFEKTSASEIAEGYAKSKGMRASVFPYREKRNFAKESDESDLDFLERIAADIGFDCWVDDETEPATLHFEPPEARGAIEIGGKSISLGWGQGSPATLLVQDFTIDWSIGESSVKTVRREKSGETKVAGETKVIRDRNSATGQVFEYRVAEALSASATSTAGVSGRPAVNARIADTIRTKRTLAVKVRPGVPWWRLNQLVPWVGHGMWNGVYRIVDITDMIDRNGYESDIRAVIGGGKASKVQQKPNANASATESDVVTDVNSATGQTFQYRVQKPGK